MKIRRIQSSVASTLALAGALVSLSCASRNTPATRASIPPSQVAPDALFGAALPGDKTEGVIRVEELLAELIKYTKSGRNQQAQKIGFRIPEREVNEYLAYSFKANPRPGISRLIVQMFPDNQVSSLAEIDFDSLRRWTSWIIPDPLHASLSGKRAVRVEAKFEANDGLLTLTVQRALGPDGSAIPIHTMEDVIQSIGLHQPETYDTMHSFPLPFGLRRVWTERQLFAGET